MRKPFNLLHHFIANGGGAAIAPSAPVHLPPNAPPQVVNQIWQQVAQHAQRTLGQPAIEVEYQLVNAIIESPRVAAEFSTKGMLTAARLPSGEIKILATDREAEWREVPTTPKVEANE